MTWQHLRNCNRTCSGCTHRAQVQTLRVAPVEVLHVPQDRRMLLQYMRVSVCGAALERIKVTSGPDASYLWQLVALHDMHRLVVPL